MSERNHDSECGAPPVPAAQRPVYLLKLRAEPNVDPIRSLRAALKVLLRRFGLRAVSVSEDKPGAAS
jgi:hypothetical protein